MAKINTIALQVGIAMVFFAWISMVGAQKIDGRIDLVIIAPSSALKYMDAFKSSIIDLPNQIEMGDKKARVAVVEPVHDDCKTHGAAGCKVPGAKILFKMSSDKDELAKWVSGYIPTLWEDINYHHSEAFKLIREQVFDFNSKDRAKMIIQVLNGWPFDNDRPKAYEEAKKLREKGAFIYVTYDAKSGHLNKDTKHFEDAQAYVGKDFPWRMHGSTHSDHSKMFSNALKDILVLAAEITRDLCTFCKFQEQQQCKAATRPRNSPIDIFGDGNARCENVSPTGIQCPMEECQFECNRQWPWKDPDLCKVPCINLHKRVNDNPPPGMESCPKETTCNWACTTTTPTTELITTTPTTTELITTEPTIELIITTPTTELITTTPTTALITSTPGTGSTLDPKAVVDSSDSGSEGSGSNLIWIIIGVVVGLLIIVAIIVAVVVVKRRRSAAKKKGAKDVEKGKGTKLDKGKSISGQKEDDGISTGGMKGGSVRQENIGVSMRTVMESKKPAAKSMSKTGGGKSKMSSSMKSGSKATAKMGGEKSVVKAGSKGPLKK